MIVEKHYDDLVLISLLESAERDRATVADPHLDSCANCRASLDSLREVTEVLKDEATWNRHEPGDEPAPKVMAHLNAFATQMATEDAESEVWIRELLFGPRETWVDKLAQNPQWQTAGMVRKLIEATDRAIDRSPADGVKVSELAVGIAEGLHARSLLDRQTLRMMGAAWREHAYALYYVGRFPEALAAIDRSTTAYTACYPSEYDLARADIVRALIFRAFDRIDEAFELSRRSAAVFIKYGDDERYASARSVEASMYAKIGRHHDALRVWQALEPLRLQPDTHARNWLNLGYAHHELGETGSAVHYFSLALSSFRELGNEPEISRVSWHLGVIQTAQGRYDEALSLYSVAQESFERLGMTSEAAFIQLHRAEILLVRGDSGAVVEICRDLLANFERAGLAYTERARTAIAYLKEAAAAGKATVPVLQHVREYIRSLPARPELLFAPLPT